MKMSNLQSRRISDISKGVNRTVKVEKLKFDLCLFLLWIDLVIVFADVLDGKKGFLDYENVQFTESPY